MKNNQNIEGLVLFSHINQLGSLTAAAQLLGINRSTVSKKLAVLEKSIGVRLLKRTTRKIALTEVGRKVLQEARKVEAALQSIEYISDDFQSVIAGDLNVTCAAAQGRAGLAQLDVVQPGVAKRFERAFLALPIANIAIDEWLHDIGKGRRARQQIKALKNKAYLQVANLGELVLVERLDIFPIEVILAAGWFVQTAEDVEHRRFA